MTAEELLSGLSRRGFLLTPHGAGIRVSPASRLSAEDRGALQAHRQEVLVLLRRREHEDFICRLLEADQGLPVGSLTLWRP
jgi:hypothetical protein